MQPNGVSLTLNLIYVPHNHVPLIGDTFCYSCSMFFDVVNTDYCLHFLWLFENADFLFEVLPTISEL